MPRVQTEAPATTAAPAPTVIVERPPPGLARGQYAWPAWGIALLGTFAVVAASLYLITRWRRSRSRR